MDYLNALYAHLAATREQLDAIVIETDDPRFLLLGRAKLEAQSLQQAAATFLQGVTRVLDLAADPNLDSAERVKTLEEKCNALSNEVGCLGEKLVTMVHAHIQRCAELESSAAVAKSLQEELAITKRERDELLDRLMKIDPAAAYDAWQRQSMNRIADVIVEIESAGAVVFSPRLEVKVDCCVCQRCSRTIGFEEGRTEGVCTPTMHAFPGRIVEKESQRIGDLHIVRYRVLYRYEYFVDAKHPWPPGPGLRDKWDARKATGEPTWARVRFTMTCTNCGKANEKSTQNNLFRPRPLKCDCGSVLSMETREMPMLTSRESNSA